MPLDRSPHRTCLFLDVDGSLIDIAPRPEAVVVPPTLVENLARLDALLGGAIALISGRSIAQLDRLFDPLELRASGVHGAEMRYEPGDSISHSPEDLIPGSVRDAVTQLPERFPGTFVEDKGYSLATHLSRRSCGGDPAAGRTPGHSGLSWEGRTAAAPRPFVIEVKRATFDKGVAVRRFLAQPRFAGRVPVFIGDDVTDRPGFAAAIEAGGAAFGVGVEIEGTTGTFASPSEVRRWVGSFADQEIMPA